MFDVVEFSEHKSQLFEQCQNVPAGVYINKWMINAGKSIFCRQDEFEMYLKINYFVFKYNYKYFSFGKTWIKMYFMYPHKSR